jgi:hypothetical protein
MRNKMEVMNFFDQTFEQFQDFDCKLKYFKRDSLNISI